MDDTRHLPEETVRLKRGIEQLNAGDASVRGELLNLACQRLTRLTNRLRQEFAPLDGASDEQRTDDEVFENASLRLYQALYDSPIKDARHFYHLAANQIRRELIELCRHCEQIDPDSSERMSLVQWSHWARFHDSVDGLPNVEREIFELIWYHELSREQAAELLDVPVSEVRRRWRAARLSLHESLNDDAFSVKSASN